MSKRRPKTKPKKTPHAPDVIVPDGWGEVESISKTCYHRLGLCSLAIPVITAFKESPDLTKTHIEVSRACLALLKDVPALKTELDAISQLHLDKKGDISEADEFLITIDVGQKYSEWLDRFERLIDPNLLVVAEYLDTPTQKDPSDG